MFDLDDGGWWALLLLWVGFMTVVGVYVIRIGLMIHELKARERAFRLQLAMRRGRAAREPATLTMDAGRSDR